METIGKELYFKVADSDYELQSSYRLRFKVYCEEKGWMSSADYPNGMETDSYDSKAIHVIAMDDNYQVVGNMRILPAEYYSKLPYESHPGLFRGYRKAVHVAELSRLIVTATKNRIEVTHGILRATYQISKEMGLENWIFVLEPSLVRLLGRFGFYLNAVGTPSMYFGGFTMASICNIEQCEKQWKSTNSYLWEYYQTESILAPVRIRVA